MKFQLATAILILASIGFSEQQCTDKFKREFLDRHNQLREESGVPDLVLDDSINQFAQEWADEIASSGDFEHRPNNSYGENLYEHGGRKEPSGDQTVQRWYDEIKYYEDYFGEEPDMDTFKKWGHFTQVVWKNSARVGVGCASSGRKFYVVGNYDPAGNVEGEFADNVLPPQD